MTAKTHGPGYRCGSIQCARCYPSLGFPTGARVVYRSHQNATDEFGHVVGVTDRGLIFVRFDGDTRSKACAPESLEVER